MLTKTLNPEGQNADNLVKLSEANSLRGGDRVVLGRYQVVLETATADTVSAFSLGGVEYNFSTALSTTSTAGKAAIVDEITSKLKELGYKHGSVGHFTKGANLFVRSDHSEISFDYIKDGSTVYPFVASSVKITGRKESGSAEFSLKVSERGDDDYDVEIVSLSGSPITNITVTYNAVEQYNGVVPSGGKVTFVAAEANAEALVALIVAINNTVLTTAKTQTKTFKLSLHA